MRLGASGPGGAHRSQLQVIRRAIDFIHEKREFVLPKCGH
jgi:hypothetical protein